MCAATSHKHIVKTLVALQVCLPYHGFYSSFAVFILAYLCQCVAGTEDWQRVNPEIPVKSPRFALFDLAEGKSYRFRVRSTNSAGIGEPSEATEFTEVTDKLGEYASHMQVSSRSLITCSACAQCLTIIVGRIIHDWIMFQNTLQVGNGPEHWM